MGQQQDSPHHRAFRGVGTRQHAEPDAQKLPFAKPLGLRVFEDVPLDAGAVHAIGDVSPYLLKQRAVVRVSAFSNIGHVRVPPRPQPSCDGGEGSEERDVVGEVARGVPELGDLLLDVEDLGDHEVAVEILDVLDAADARGCRSVIFPLFFFLCMGGNEVGRWVGR